MINKILRNKTIGFQRKNKPIPVDNINACCLLTHKLIKELKH